MQIFSGELGSRKISKHTAKRTLYLVFLHKEIVRRLSQFAATGTRLRKHNNAPANEKFAGAHGFNRFSCIVCAAAEHLLFHHIIESALIEQNNSRLFKNLCCGVIVIDSENNIRFFCVA